MVGFLVQQVVALAISAAALFYFGFVKYAIVALVSFLVTLSIFIGNERKLEEPTSGGYELPQKHKRAIDVWTRFGLAGWCGAVWPGLVIGAVFGWRRVGGGE